MNEYGYPNDGRGASSDPGLWTNLLSWLPNEIEWERWTPQLNGRFDRWVSRYCGRHPRSLLGWVLQVLFGNRKTNKELDSGS